MTNKQKATGENRVPFDLDSFMAMMEEMMGSMVCGCDCGEMTSQMASEAESGGCGEMMSQMANQAESGGCGEIMSHMANQAESGSCADMMSQMMARFSGMPNDTVEKAGA